MPRELTRSIGFLSGSAIMVGIIIGGGIFQAPTEIAREMGSPALILALWAVGGLVSLFGALAYAELSTMFPESGGIYTFLRAGYGDMVAFVFGWTYLLVTKPLGAGGIAIVFATHVNSLFGAHWDPRIITCVALTILTVINTFPVRLGGGVAILLTGSKIAALLAIVLFGLLLISGSTANFQAVAAPKPLWAALAPVMVAILWTYDGWSDVGSIAGEVREPQRTLPRIFLAGAAGTTVLYLLVNAVYMWLIPPAEMRELDTVAPLVMERLLGPAASTVVTIMILVSTLGSTHGSIITGARVSFAQANDGLLFRFLGRVHPRFHTPAAALWCQLVLSCAAVCWMGTFEKLTGGFVFTMWIFYGLAVAAVPVLRFRPPELARPYRCWGYPVVPVLFILAAAGMTVLLVLESPTTTLPWLAILIGGAPAYLLWRSLQAKGIGSSGRRAR